MILTVAAGKDNVVIFRINVRHKLLVFATNGNIGLMIEMPMDCLNTWSNVIRFIGDVWELMYFVAIHIEDCAQYFDIVVWDGEIVDQDYYRRDFLKKAVDEIQ